MNPNKALWEKGDFTRIAESMRESGEALVKGLGITKGLKVLDLGWGEEKGTGYFSDCFRGRPRLRSVDGRPHMCLNLVSMKSGVAQPVPFSFPQPQPC